MICETCNGAGRARIKKKLFVMKGKCPSCFGSGSVCRQQIRNSGRKTGRAVTALRNLALVNPHLPNRQARRDVIRFMRKRNDAQAKKLAGQTKVRYHR